MWTMDYRSVVFLAYFACLAGCDRRLIECPVCPELVEPQRRETSTDKTCPVDHFYNIDKDACQKCKQADPLKKELIWSNEECGNTTDAFVRCESNYYRYNNYSDNCVCNVTCMECSYCGLGEKLYFGSEVQSCQWNSDVICCKTENVVNGVCLKTEDNMATERLVNNMNNDNSSSSMLYSHVAFIEIFVIYCHIL